MPTPSAYVDENEDALAAWLLTLLSYDTANPPGDTRAAMAWLREWAADRGLETQTVADEDAKPNLLFTIPGATETTLLYNGHVDTVPYDASEWTRDPLGERVGDRIYGRGATDMKGPLAAMLLACAAYADTGVTPPVTLTFAFVSDEETGGSAGVGTLLDHDTVDADACVVGETTCERGRHSVTVADRGSIWLTLAASGTSAHGSRPPAGTNAIDRLYGAVDAIRDRIRGLSLDFDADVAAIVDESVEYYAPMMGNDAAHDLFNHPTVNLGVFQGGDAVNTVPDAARARLDVRVTARVDTAAYLDEIRDAVSAFDGVTIEDASWSVGTATSPDHPLVSTTVDVATAVTGDRIYRRSATGGGDAKKFRHAGVPTVEFALGTDTVHAVDEYTTIPALTANAAVYAELPRRLAEWMDAEV